MRFLNADPIGFSGGSNWFAYADGNPISLSDPFGLCAGINACTGGYGTGNGSVPKPQWMINLGEGIDNAISEISYNMPLEALGPNPAMFFESAGLLLARGTQAANSGNLSSRLAPGGGLMAHENAGGHLLARHVGQTDAQLAARLAGNPRLPAASTFATRAEAEAATSSAFDHNAAQLSNWMGGGAQGRLILNAPFSGGSVLQSGASAVAPGTGVRAVLQGNGSGAYNILTGFPTP